MKKKNVYQVLNLIGFSLVIVLLLLTFYLEKIEGILPCSLCLLQRFVFVTIGILFLLNALIKWKTIGCFIFTFLNLLLSGLGIGLAGRQVWLQHFFVNKNPTDCGASFTYLFKILPFDELIRRTLSGTGDCAAVNWAFLQLSLAAWSCIAFIVFFVLSFTLLKILTFSFFEKKDK